MAAVAAVTPLVGGYLIALMPPLWYFVTIAVLLLGAITHGCVVASGVYWKRPGIFSYSTLSAWSMIWIFSAVVTVCLAFVFDAVVNHYVADDLRREPYLLLLAVCGPFGSLYASFGMLYLHERIDISINSGDSVVEVIRGFPFTARPPQRIDVYDAELDYRPGRVVVTDGAGNRHKLHLANVEMQPKQAAVAFVKFVKSRHVSEG